MKRCYLWLGKINGVGLGRVLSIGTKDGDAVYLLESEYRKNIAQAEKSGTHRLLNYANFYPIISAYEFNINPFDCRRAFRV